jgi:hypothetical protein
MSGSLTLIFAIHYYPSPVSQSPGVGSTSRDQVSETQPNSLPLQVTGTYPYHSALVVAKYVWLVLRAHNLPRLKGLLGKDKRFYATVTYRERIWQTRSVRSAAHSVEWNENVDTLWEMFYLYFHIQLTLP